MRLDPNMLVVIFEVFFYNISSAINLALGYKVAVFRQNYPLYPVPVSPEKEQKIIIQIQLRYSFFKE